LIASFSNISLINRGSVNRDFIAMISMFETRLATLTGNSMNVSRFPSLEGLADKTSLPNSW
jgi:hypothetical protein